MGLGQTVKRLRVERGWKQQDLAQRSGIAQGYLSALERNEKTNPTQDTLSKLALAFGLSVPMLLREAGMEFTRERPELPGLDALAPEIAAMIRRDAARLTPGQWKVAAAFLEWLAAQGPQEPAAYDYQAPARGQDEQTQEGRQPA